MNVHGLKPLSAWRVNRFAGRAGQIGSRRRRRIFAPFDAGEVNSPFLSKNSCL
jgi:hypothetical protein